MPVTFGREPGPGISLGANRQTEWENRGGLALLWSRCGAKRVTNLVLLHANPGVWSIFKSYLLARPYLRFGDKLSFTFRAKPWKGHRAGRSPCAHSIGKFFLWLIGVFFGNFRPRLARLYLYSFQLLIGMPQAVVLVRFLEYSYANHIKYSN